MDIRACAVIPTFNNAGTIESVAAEVSRHVPVIVVDDASDPSGRDATDHAARSVAVTVVRRAHNGGKGAAVRDGLAKAHALGYSHALQIDADRQHDEADIPTLLAAARAQPKALILGAPRFDESAPAIRLLGRQLTVSLVHVECLSRAIDDPMCGFRVYPLATACPASLRCGDRMEFDVEVAVRLVRGGTTVVNVPTRVRYPDDGVSHFHMVADNARLSWMHTRLLLGVPLWLLGGWRRPSAAA